MAEELGRVFSVAFPIGLVVIPIVKKLVDPIFNHLDNSNLSDRL